MKLIDSDWLFEIGCFQCSGISALEEYMFLRTDVDTERGYFPTVMDMLDTMTACDDPNFWATLKPTYYSDWQKKAFLKSIRQYLIDRQRLSQPQEWYVRTYYKQYLKYQLESDNSAELYFNKLFTK